MADDKGQIDGTPTVDTGTTGQEKVAASPGSETDQILAAAAADEKAAADKAAGKVDDKTDDKKAGKEAGAEGDEKPLPYDQDPKWIKARAAEKKFDDILEKHGLDSAEDLDDLVASGSSISEILGARDAKTLIEIIKQNQKDAEYLKEVKAYWAEQEALKQKDELTPEQRAEMSESKLKAYEKEQADKKAKATEEESIKTALDNYSEQVDKAVESSGFEDDEAVIAKLFLGVDNPFNEVDITDKKAVRETAKTNAAKFKTFLDNVRQKAVDEYSKGKSKIVPISTIATPGKETVARKGIPEGTVVDNAFIEKTFADASNEVMELVRQLESSGS